MALAVLGSSHATARGRVRRKEALHWTVYRRLPTASRPIPQVFPAQSQSSLGSINEYRPSQYHGSYHLVLDELTQETLELSIFDVRPGSRTSHTEYARSVLCAYPRPYRRPRSMGGGTYRAYTHDRLQGSTSHYVMATRLPSINPSPATCGRTPNNVLSLVEHQMNYD